MTHRANGIAEVAFRFLLLTCITLGGAGLLMTQEGCSCDPPPPADAGPEPIPEATGPFPTKIRFVTPVSQQTISGQISIEVEVIDPDGIKEVQFLINGKPYRTEDSTSKNSTKESPRYEVQIATSFLPRGVLHLTVKTEDNGGEKLEKTIQVKTRERWVAAFGVGQVRQLHVREDRHMYLRVYRSEQDISRVTNPGPYDQVGSVIITGNAVGAASWIYRGLGEEFSDMAFDAANNVYLGARNSEKKTSRLMAIGPGDSKWTPEVGVVPIWETALNEWSVKGTPVTSGDSVWVHLEKPAQAPNPAVSVLARFTMADGKEVWRFTSTSPIQILRGPYIVGKDEILIFTRDAAKPDAGFAAQLIGSDGKSVWDKVYPDQRINVILPAPTGGRIYAGIEQRAGKDVVNSAVLCIDPTAKKECWRVDTGTTWPGKLSLGETKLFVQRHPKGGALQVAALGISDGKELWMKEYKDYSISGIYAVKDNCIVLGVSIDEFQDPITMYIERYDDAGKEIWKYENKQYYPLNWLIASEGVQTLWVIVRNIEDKREQLGHKVLALNEKGERHFIFSEEARKHQFMQYFSKDILFLTSTDSRDARVHNLLAR